jgi:hypothetical protein
MRASDRGRYIKIIEDLEAENQRLRAALEEYANEDNWMVYNDPEQTQRPEYTWRMQNHPGNSSFHVGPQIAQAALAPALDESEVKECRS